MTRQRVMLRDALTSTPGDVGRLVRRVDDGLARPVLAHLVAVEQATATNLHLAVSDERPFLVDEHDRGGGRHEPLASPHPGQLLRWFEDARHETLRHLDALPDDGWSRVVNHAALGATRVITVVRRLLDHDMGHLGELADARRRPSTDREPTHG